MENLIILILTLLVAYFVGTKIIEKKHYRSILERERKFLSLPAVTAKTIIAEGRAIQDARLVTGSVVVSIDYFKQFLGGLRNIFGGEVGAFETILDRARREAILRMKETAEGADIIISMRLETSTIGGGEQGKSIGCSEVIAYGTAITFKK